MDSGVGRGGIGIGNAGPNASAQAARSLPAVAFAGEREISAELKLSVGVEGPTIYLRERPVALLGTISPEPDGEGETYGSGTVPRNATGNSRYTRFFSR